MLTEPSPTLDGSMKTEVLQLEESRGSIPPIIRTAVGIEDEEPASPGHLILAFHNRTPEELAAIDETAGQYVSSSAISALSEKQVGRFIISARKKGLVRKPSFVIRLRRYIGSL